jgi:hypothetical protein
MTKNIRPAEKTYQPIRDISATLPRMDAEQVREALGAEDRAQGRTAALTPVTRFALREEPRGSDDFLR